MAIRRTALPRPRLAASALIAATVAGLLVATAQPAVALPPSAFHPPAAAAVAAEVRALQGRTDRLVEAYDAATVARDAVDRRLAALERTQARQRARVAALRAGLGQVAATAYQDAGVGPLAMLVGSSPQQFFDQAGTLDVVAHDTQLQISAARRAERQLARTQLAVTVAARRYAELRHLLAVRTAAIVRTLHAEQALLASLTPPVRQAILAGPPVPESHRIAQAAASTNGRAGIAVRFAYAQLGKPYQWGAAGPDSYDCSGLTMAAWGAAGVSLPHSAAAQDGSGPQVPYAALRPGDLVFFGTPISHVGIYIGGGDMIHAPHTGAVVSITSVASMGDYVGAVRP